MTLPVTRNTTYSSGDAVKSADLNAIQDEIIAINAGQFSSRKLVIPIVGAYRSVGNLAVPTEAVVAASEKIRVPLTLSVGDRILEALVYVRVNAGSETVELDLLRRGRTSGSTTSIDSNTGAAVGEIVLASLSHVVVEDSNYHLSIENQGSGSISFSYLELTIDHP